VSIRWVLPHQASEVVPLSSHSNSEAARPRLRVRRRRLQNLPPFTSITSKDNDPTDVLYRVVRNAGRARSSTLAPNINNTASLFWRNTNTSTLTSTESTTLRPLDTLVSASFLACIFGSSPCIITTLDIRIDVSIPSVTQPSLRNHFGRLEESLEEQTTPCQIRGCQLLGAACIRLILCMSVTEHGIRSATHSCCPI
jgi:hypothetical protein